MWETGEADRARTVAAARSSSQHSRLPATSVCHEYATVVVLPVDVVCFGLGKVSDLVWHTKESCNISTGRRAGHTLRRCQICQLPPQLNERAWSSAYHNIKQSQQDTTITPQPLEQALALILVHLMLQILPDHLSTPVAGPREHGEDITHGGLQASTQQADILSDPVERRLEAWIALGTIKLTQGRADSEELAYDACDLRGVAWQTISEDAQA